MVARANAFVKALWKAEIERLREELDLVGEKIWSEVAAEIKKNL